MVPSGISRRKYIMKKIAVLTSGGDAPGMNAAIRAVVRTAIYNGIEVMGVQRGYSGLINGELFSMDKTSVSDIIHRGGTILRTARCEEFKKEEVRKEAVKILQDNGVDALVVIGGDGSFTGAKLLSKLGVKTIGLPGTIDNDLTYTDYTIGFDTAVNTAMEAADKLRDTSGSHERCNIIEVMGRTAGHIALWCGIANGSEYALLPETYNESEIDKLIAQINEKTKIGKRHHIIVNAEGIGHSEEIAKRIKEETGIDTRATIIGHIQRGGSPTCRDRVYASAMGSRAVDLLHQGQTSRVVAFCHGEFTDYSIQAAMEMQKTIDHNFDKLIHKLSR